MESMINDVALLEKARESEIPETALQQTPSPSQDLSWSEILS